jgi:hypothetical protein
MERPAVSDTGPSIIGMGGPIIPRADLSRPARGPLSYRKDQKKKMCLFSFPSPGIKFSYRNNIDPDLLVKNKNNFEWNLALGISSYLILLIFYSTSDQLVVNQKGTFFFLDIGGSISRPLFLFFLLRVGCCEPLGA